MCRMVELRWVRLSCFGKEMLVRGRVAEVSIADQASKQCGTRKVISRSWQLAMERMNPGGRGDVETWKPENLEKQREPAPQPRENRGEETTGDGRGDATGRDLGTNLESQK